MSKFLARKMCIQEITVSVFPLVSLLAHKKMHHGAVFAIRKIQLNNGLISTAGTGSPGYDGGMQVTQSRLFIPACRCGHVNDTYIR